MNWMKNKLNNEQYYHYTNWKNSYINCIKNNCQDEELGMCDSCHTLWLKYVKTLPKETKTNKLSIIKDHGKPEVVLSIDGEVKTTKLNRIEIVNWTGEKIEIPADGCLRGNSQYKIELDIQDDYQTIKLFYSKKRKLMV